MTDVNPKLAARLRELRGETSLYEVEKQTAVPRSNLTRYEQGHHLPTEAVLKKLAAYYRVTYEELRTLYYDDLFRRHPEERRIVINWARTVEG